MIGLDSIFSFTSPRKHYFVLHLNCISQGFSLSNVHYWMQETLNFIFNVQRYFELLCRCIVNSVLKHFLVLQCSGLESGNINDMCYFHEKSLDEQKKCSKHNCIVELCNCNIRWRGFKPLLDYFKIVFLRLLTRGQVHFVADSKI